jgi:hypothetical protein
MAAPANNPCPERPTPELVRQYVRRFDSSADGRADQALVKLFQTFPENQQQEHVTFKVLALNAFKNSKVSGVTSVVRHIVSLNIDAKLAEGVPELVNQIAAAPDKNGRIRRNYSFASKYCSWHVPNAYPIYDGVVDGLLWAYQQADKFTDAFWHSALGDYPRFRRIVEAFQAYYGLTEFSFRDLDKFLWLSGKAYFGKTAVPSPKPAEE